MAYCVCIDLPSLTKCYWLNIHVAFQFDQKVEGSYHKLRIEKRNQSKIFLAFSNFKKKILHQHRQLTISSLWNYLINLHIMSFIFFYKSKLLFFNLEILLFCLVWEKMWNHLTCINNFYSKMFHEAPSTHTFSSPTMHNITFGMFDSSRPLNLIFYLSLYVYSTCEGL